MKTHHKELITYKTIQPNFQAQHWKLNNNPSFEATCTLFIYNQNHREISQFLYKWKIMQSIILIKSFQS